MFKEPKHCSAAALLQLNNPKGQSLLELKKQGTCLEVHDHLLYVVRRSDSLCDPLTSSCATFANPWLVIAGVEVLPVQEIASVADHLTSAVTLTNM